MNTHEVRADELEIGDRIELDDDEMVTVESATFGGRPGITRITATTDHSDQRITVNCYRGLLWRVTRPEPTPEPAVSVGVIRRALAATADFSDDPSTWTPKQAAVVRNVAAMLTRWADLGDRER